MKRRGQIESMSWLLGGLFILFISALVIFVVLQTTVSFKMGLVKGSDELQAMSVVNRLLASEECFSTGDIGILDREKIESWVGRDFDCAFLPELSYRIVIKDLQTDDRWSFGELDPEQANMVSIKKEMNIAITDDTGIHPAYMSVKFLTSDVDTSLRLRKAAYMAWVDGESKASLQIKKGYARFEPYKICYAEYSQETCSEVRDFTFGNAPVKFDREGSIILEFKKIGNSIEVSRYA